MAHIKLLASNISFIQYLNIILFLICRDEALSIINIIKFLHLIFSGSLSQLLRASFYNRAASIGIGLNSYPLSLTRHLPYRLSYKDYRFYFHNTKISIISNIIFCKLLYDTNSKNYVRSGEFMGSCNMDICCDLLSVARPVRIDFTTQK